MLHNRNDFQIREIEKLKSPMHVIQEFSCTKIAFDTVYATRKAFHKILYGIEDRLAVIVGPCSIHDVNEAMIYAKRLQKIRVQLKETLEIIMRVYFEKPRTTVGWKGLINDPDLNNSFHINKGISLARKLLLDINNLGLPAGCEFLDVITPQYIMDLISWGSIGARTTESQIHRELVSGLSLPVGFKNGTDGNIKIAIDAIKAASQGHHLLSVTKDGHLAIFSTRGNKNCHLILRGGQTPNYDTVNVQNAIQEISKSNLIPRLIIDISHSNSGKNPDNQPIVLEDIAHQIESGNSHIMGIMIESYLHSGRQDLIIGKSLAYGQSITDGCISWDKTVKMLERLDKSVRLRRKMSR